jgi:hypothetical protein
MKLGCEVVKDLYVLYEQNELSEPVRAAVKEHIGDCKQCRQLYESGQGFDSIYGNIRRYDAPEEVHTKLMKKLNKKRRLIAIFIAALLLVSTILTYIVKDFTESRKILSRDANLVAHKIEMLGLMMNYVKEDKLEDLMKVQTQGHFRQIYGEDSNYEKSGADHGAQWYQDFKENQMSIYSLKLMLRYTISFQAFIFSYDLNKHEKKYMEKNHYEHLSIGYTLFDAAVIMKQRYENNQWTEDDERYFTELKNNLDQYSVLLTKECIRLSDIGRLKKISFNTNIDMESIVNYHKNINGLSREYVEKYED